MINDYAALIASGVVIFSFVIFGFLDILYNPIIKMLLIVGFGFLIINIIIVKSKDDNDTDQQKNLP